MAKRPSYVSIRARQRNIVEGIGTRNIRYAQAAKELGVTQDELKRFVEQRPADLRRNFNRSPAYKKLYDLGERRKTREALGLEKIRRYEYKPSRVNLPSNLRKYPNANQIGRMIEHYYVTNHQDAYSWAVWTREHNLPSSKSEIKVLYYAGDISEVDYEEAIAAWEEFYKTNQW